MQDVLWIGVTVAFFAVSIAYVYALRTPEVNVYGYPDTRHSRHQRHYGHLSVLRTAAAGEILK